MARRPGETFPSDEARRKNKPAVRIHHSIAWHPRMTAVYADNDLLATWLRIMLMASTAHAGKTGDWVSIPSTALLQVTCRTRTGSAQALIKKLAGLLQWECRLSTGTVAIHVRNFSRKQGFDPAISGGDAGVIAGTPDPSESDSESGGVKERVTPSPTSPSSATAATSTGGGESVSKPGEPEPTDGTGFVATHDFVIDLWQRRMPKNPIVRADEQATFARDLRGRLAEYPDKGEWLRLVVDQLPRQPYLVRGDRTHPPISLAKLVANGKLFRRALEAQYQPEKTA